jgi:hypothetical protein
MLEGLVTTNQQSGAVIGFLTGYITPGSPLSDLGDLMGLEIVRQYLQV